LIVRAYWATTYSEITIILNGLSIFKLAGKVGRKRIGNGRTVQWDSTLTRVQIPTVGILLLCELSPDCGARMIGRRKVNGGVGTVMEMERCVCARSKQKQVKPILAARARQPPGGPRRRQYAMVGARTSAPDCQAACPIAVAAVSPAIGHRARLPQPATEGKQEREGSTCYQYYTHAYIYIYICIRKK
jgi:hypothetical protein